jgi:hypothetical protein
MVKNSDVLQKISDNAAFDDSEIPTCLYLTKEELACVRVDELPEGGTVSIPLEEAFGDLPNPAAQARLYGTSDDLRVLVTHEVLEGDEIPFHLTPEGYAGFIENRVKKFSNNVRLSYLSTDVSYPDWMVEYIIVTTGETLFDHGSKGNEIAYNLEDLIASDVSMHDDYYLGLSNAGRSVMLEDLNQLEYESDSYKKGILLEKIISDLFVSLGGIEWEYRHRWSTSRSEIDLVFTSVGRNVAFTTNSPLIFVECKNQKDPVGTGEIGKFEMKIKDSGNECSLAFFVSWNGYTKGVEEELKGLRREPYLIVTMDGKGIKDAIEKGDFSSYVKRRYEAALKR